MQSEVDVNKLANMISDIQSYQREREDKNKEIRELEKDLEIAREDLEGLEDYLKRSREDLDEYIAQFVEDEEPGIDYRGGFPY